MIWDWQIIQPLKHLNAIISSFVVFNIDKLFGFEMQPAYLVAFFLYLFFR